VFSNVFPKIVPFEIMW